MEIPQQSRVQAIGTPTSKEDAAFEAEERTMLGELGDLEEGAHLQRVDLLWRLGRHYEDHTRLEKALQVYLQASEILRDLGEELALGQILHSCGNIEAQLGRVDKADTLLRAAEKVFERAGELDLLGAVRFDRGFMLLRAHRLEAARDATKAAVRTASDAKDALGQAHAHLLLGQIEVEANIERARWNFDRARMIYLDWDARNPKDSIRIATPPAPAAVDDPRKFEAGELAAYCDFRCEQLAMDPRESVVESVPVIETVSLGLAQELGNSALVILLASVMFVGLPVAWTLLGMDLVEADILFVALAGLASIATFLGVLYAGNESRWTHFLSPLVAGMVVFQVNSKGLLLQHVSRPVAVAAEADADPGATGSRSAPAPAAAVRQAQRGELVRAAESLRKSENHTAVTDVLTKVVVLDESLGDTDAQREDLSALADAQRRAGQSAAEIGSLARLVDVELLQGRQEGAVKTWSRMVEAASAGGQTRDEAVAYLGVARSAMRVGDRNKALDSLTHAESLFEKIGDDIGRGDVEMERGRIHSGSSTWSAHTSRSTRSRSSAVWRSRAHRSRSGRANQLSEAGSFPTMTNRRVG